MVLSLRRPHGGERSSLEYAALDSIAQKIHNRQQMTRNVHGVICVSVTLYVDVIET